MDGQPQGAHLFEQFLADEESEAIHGDASSSAAAPGASAPTSSPRRTSWRAVDALEAGQAATPAATTMGSVQQPPPPGPAPPPGEGCRVEAHVLAPGRGAELSDECLHDRLLAGLRVELEDRPCVARQQLLHGCLRDEPAAVEDGDPIADALDVLRMWVLMRMVAVPRRPPMSSSTSRRPAGSRALTGSSRKMTEGRGRMAWPTPRRCRMPPE